MILNVNLARKSGHDIARQSQKLEILDLEFEIQM